ncbi:hypothetical protein HHI36_013077 [Cryptolaemus montrouzieri]|uniref:Uncharacterized protein n=1 Tax=Cryptolaemus montrouzieri TaxID=559131 RepID=A0ABD2NH88_9CUCU
MSIKGNRLSTQLRKLLKEDDEFDGMGINIKITPYGRGTKTVGGKVDQQNADNGVKGRLREETNLCALKFMQPQMPARRADRTIPNSIDQNLIQTTSNSNRLLESKIPHVYL